MTHEQISLKEIEHSTKREWLKYGLGLVLFLLISFGLLLALNPDGLRLFFGGAKRYTGAAPIDITVVHSNDTYGYLEGCG